MLFRHGVSLFVLASGLHLAAHCQALDAVIQVCSQCHGGNGVSVQPNVPHLNGQLPEAFVDIMAAYADGSRPTAVSEHKRLAVQEQAPTARFFGAQKNSPRPRQVTDPERVKKGEQIYNGRCEHCHIDSGRDSDGEAPILAAQDLGFLVAQTLAFKAGVRKLPFMMDRSFTGLTEDDLVSVAHFFAAQDLVAQPVDKKPNKKRNF